jgi:hypothetical protein
VKIGVVVSRGVGVGVREGVAEAVGESTTVDVKGIEAVGVYEGVTEAVAVTVGVDDIVCVGVCVRVAVDVNDGIMVAV